MWVIISPVLVVPSSDPDGRDGNIIGFDKNNIPVGIAFEQVFIPRFIQGDLEMAIIDAINKKTKKGKHYAEGYGLIIFSDKNGQILIPSLSKKIDCNYFESCWLISKLDKNSFAYLVCLMKSTAGDPIGEYIVDINIRDKKITIGHAVDVMEKLNKN